MSGFFEQKGAAETENCHFRSPCSPRPPVQDVFLAVGNDHAIPATGLHPQVGWRIFGVDLHEGSRKKNGLNWVISSWRTPLAYVKSDSGIRRIL
jgi:hypothetical protein